MLSSIFSLVLSIIWTIMYPLRVVGNIALGRVIEFVQTKYRWVIVIPLVLPLSLLYNLYSHVRNLYIWYMKSSPTRHAQKVARVAKQVRENGNEKMCTNRPGYESTSLFVGKYKQTMKKVDLSEFIDVLEINTKKQTVRVEPLVTCGQLSHTLLPLGWTPAILPELDDLTVGGLIMGFGIETSSHKFGLFQHICVSYEVVLPGGKVVTCSADENPDLYYAIPWSYGTIGFLLSAEIKIVPAKKYAKITYEPFQTSESMLDAFKAASNDEKNDFVEMLAYGPDKGVLMTGVMTNEAEFWKTHRIGRFWGPWFYKHVEKYLTTGKAVEYIPLRDYYHRHTRSLFWQMEDIIPFGHNLIFRVLLGWLVPPKVSFLKLTTTPELHELQKKLHIIEDFLVPLSTLPKTLEMQEDLISFYPLWLCPTKIFKTPLRGLVNPAGDEEMYVDVGIYGIPPAARPERGEKFDEIACHHKAEKFVRDIGGFQALYTQTYQTREEFAQMFDHELYLKVREKYGCDKVLPLVYDKVSREARL